jgi:hypothetical protein
MDVDSLIDRVERNDEKQGENQQFQTTPTTYQKMLRLKEYCNSEKELKKDLK